MERRSAQAVRMAGEVSGWSRIAGTSRMMLCAKRSIETNSSDELAATKAEACSGWKAESAGSLSSRLFAWTLRARLGSHRPYKSLSENGFEAAEVELDASPFSLAAKTTAGSRSLGSTREGAR